MVNQGKRKPLMHRVIRSLRNRMTIVMADEDGMSTVEYSTGPKTYRERIPRWLLQRLGAPRLFER